MKYRLVYLTVALIALCGTFLPAAVSAQDKTIQGKTFYKDGKPWLPKRIKIEAFNGYIQGTKDHPAPFPNWRGGKLLAGYPND